MGRPPGGSDRSRHCTRPPTLVGRRRELQQVRTAVDRLRTGAGSAVLVEGEPGIGKSRLLRYGAHVAAERGFLTFSGRGEELERHRPLHAFTALLGPGLSTPSEDALVDAVVDRVAGLATRSPVVVVIDDLNWCDQASLRATGALADRPDTDRVLVLAGAQPLPRSRSLERVCERLLGPVGRHLLLGPLPSREVVELAATLLDARPGPTLEAVLDTAGGNPLYVTELVRALVEDGSVRVVDGRAECTCTVLPASLRRLVLQRLTVLPDAVQELLRLASILGDPFTITDLEALTGADAVDLAGPLASAARAGFLGDPAPRDPAGGADDRLSFRHEMVREVLRTDLPVAVRTGLRRRAGDAPAAAGVAVPEALRPLRQRHRAAFLGQGAPPFVGTAFVREDSADALVSGSRSADTGTAQQRSQPSCTDHGTARDRDRVGTRQRGQVVRSRPRGGPQRSSTGWGALTPAERTVVSLVAQGLTNRQIGDRLFVSRRTVETHLAHVFDKLGVPNRAGVAALTAQHTLDPESAPGPAAEERCPAQP